MQRRKFMIGLGGTVLGTGAVIGSGAFSSVQAERSMTVETSHDANANLELNPLNNNVASYDGAQKLELTFEDLNRNATTMWVEVFEIVNNGQDTVGIQIDRPDLPGSPSSHVHFFVGEQGGETLSAYDREEMAGELDYSNPGSDDRVLESGDSLPVGLYFLNDDVVWDEDVSVTINALDEDTANHIAP